MNELAPKVIILTDAKMRSVSFKGSTCNSSIKAERINIERSLRLKKNFLPDGKEFKAEGKVGQANLGVPGLLSNS